MKLQVFRPYAGSCLASLSVLFLVGCAAPKRGVLIMAHGGDPTWNRDVEAVIEPVRAKYPTEIAFGMAQTSTIRDAVRKLEKQGVREIAVVRMFVSGDSFVPSTEYILGLRDTPPLDPLASRGNEQVKPENTPALAVAHDAALGSSHVSRASGHDDHRLTDHAHTGHCMETPEPIQSVSRFMLSQEGVAASPLIDEILLDRVMALSTDPTRESVLILAHGPADDAENERWLVNMNSRAAQLRAAASFRAVHCATLREDWPDKRREAESRIRDFVRQANGDGGRCIVIPFRIAGFGEYDKVLADLTYVADGRGFCPHPRMTQWIEETASNCFDR